MQIFSCKAMALFWKVSGYILLLYFSLLVPVDSCTERSVYHVSSGGNDSEHCLVPDQDSDMCGSLHYLLLHIHQCATVMVMDDLTLSSTVLQLNSSGGNVSIQGFNDSFPSVTVYCEGSSGFLVQNASGVSFKDLHFEGCSFNASEFLNKSSQESSILASIVFDGTEDLQVSRCYFTSNIGAAILLLDVQGTATIANTTFLGNSSQLDEPGMRSGGIVMRRSISHLFSNSLYITFCTFTYNAVKGLNHSKLVPGIGSSIGYGGAIDVEIDKMKGRYDLVLILISHCAFLNNRATNGGAVSIVFKNNLLNNSFTLENCDFYRNKAENDGGALFLANGQSDDDISITTPVRISSCTFTGNEAKRGGGVAVQVMCNGCSGTKVEISGGQWNGNSASAFGFAIYFVDSVILLKGRTFFCDNKYMEIGDYISGLGTVALDSSFLIFETGDTFFIRNEGTALALLNGSQVQIYNNATFMSNTGVHGGAILIMERSFLTFNFPCNVEFLNNLAWILGGAIFSRATSISRCGLLVEDSVGQVIFQNNSANGISQSVSVDTDEACLPTKQDIIKKFRFFPNNLTQILFSSDEAEITLEAVPKVTKLKIMLGEKFYLKPVSISIRGVAFLRLWTKENGYSEGTTLKGPSNIGYDDYNSEIDFYIQGPEVHTRTHYHIVLLYEQENGYHIGKTNLSLVVVPCRMGYQYDHTLNVCMCASSKSKNIMCTSSGQHLCLKRQYWYSDDYDQAFPCPISNCWYMHGRCPTNTESCSNTSDYCSIKHSNDVCWYGRSGFLCSGCAHNYSFTYSAFQCVHNSFCTAGRTAVVAVALVAYWIVVVIVLLVVLSLNLNVGSGFVYGIIYFFSVATIYTRSSKLFSDLWLRIVIYVDMAITLLDLELIGYTNLCFVKSWDSPLHHTLFRYMTPIFVITTIASLILISKYCRVPKKLSLAENSPIHAICLLVLLSYTSIACTSFRLLTPLAVNGTLKVQIAPDVDYFGKEHAPYAFFALCAEFFVSLPICFLLLFANCLSRRINFVKLRLKPIIDEFQACYQPKYSWFAGFYFLARQVVFFAKETTMDIPQSNLILATINILVVIIHTSFQPYRKKWLNVLDTILLMNIVFLSMVPSDLVESYSYVNQFFQNRVLPIVLVLVPTIILFGILLFIVLKKLRHLARGNSTVLLKMKKHRLVGFVSQKRHSSTNNTNTNQCEPSERTSKSSRHSTQNDQFYCDASSLREPLLDDSYEEEDHVSPAYPHLQIKSYGACQQKPNQFTSGSLRLPHTN